MLLVSAGDKVYYMLFYLKLSVTYQFYAVFPFHSYENTTETSGE